MMVSERVGLHHPTNCNGEGDDETRHLVEASSIVRWGLAKVQVK